MEQVNGEARLDWRPNENTTVIGSGGIAWVASTIEITPAGGGVQLRDWRYWFLQARLSYKRLFANLFLNRNGAGDTYILRTGQRIVDDSWQLGGRMHHGSEIGQRLSLLYGIDFQHTVPRTGGTTNGRFEDDDEWTELGGYLHTATVLSPKFDLIVASRVDHHSRLNDLAFSPRVALVYKPAPAHALRLTYNRAFGKPGSLSHDILAGSLRPFGLPYDARKISTPEDGWNFRRDCGGLCMRSPFHDDPNQYLAADAALVWDAVVQLLQEQGVDLSGLPAPDATQVASELRVLNPATLEFDPVDESDVRDIPGPARRITNSLETGYKGVIGGRLFLTVDAWYTRVANFNAAQAIVTPNVFFQEASLADYLSGFMPADQARQLAASIAQIPLGTVTPQEALDPVDLLLDAAVGGALDRWGLDLYAEAQLTDVFFVGGNYSWVDRDSVPVPGITNRILGAPKNKGSLWVDYRNDRLGLTAGLRGRAVSSFPLKNGVYQGRVAAYEVLDLSVGYRLPPARNILLTLTAYNVLDDRHQEMVGAPELGRLLVTRLRVGF